MDNPFVKMLIYAGAAILASDLAQSFVPASLDLMSFPVRKYAGGFAGVYLANMLVGGVAKQG